MNISRQPHPQTFIVQVSDITSSEVYRYPGGREEAVLRGITIDVKRGECWGIIGDEAFELELLMQIIANVRSYGSGQCALVERGMMRRKRSILPHVFFISGGDTVPGNLNTLEYLMYVTARTQIPDRKRQAFILKTLLASGLYYLTLAPLKFLSAAERAAVCLLSAVMSNALLVVFSVADLIFQPQLSQGIRYIINKYNQTGSAVLIGTSDCDMVQAACTHAAFLIDGQFSQCGRIGSLLNALDQRAFILKSDTPEPLAKAIRDAEEGLEAYVFDKEVHVYTRTKGSISQAAMMRIILDSNLTIESLQVSQRTLRNAYQEVLAGHVI